MGIFDDFISREDRPYRFRIGKTVASGLTGFIVGFLVTFVMLGLWLYVVGGR